MNKFLEKLFLGWCVVGVVFMVLGGQARADREFETFLPVMHTEVLNTHGAVSAEIERVYPDPDLPISGYIITAMAWWNDDQIILARRSGEIGLFTVGTGEYEMLFRVQDAEINGTHLGLLGLTVSDGATVEEKSIYVSYSNGDKEAVISQFDQTGETETVLMRIKPLHTDNSRGGVQTHHVPPIRFYRASTGDGFLLVMNGDGDMQEVPSMLPQDECSVWGKIFALSTDARDIVLQDVDYVDDPHGLEYETPYNLQDYCGIPEITPLMLGVRHPWGGHVVRDNLGRDLLIFADVGHDKNTWGDSIPDESKMAFDEINTLVLDLDTPPPNGGWPQYEGPQTDPRSTKYGGPLTGTAHWPDLALDHDVEPQLYGLHRSVTGGNIISIDDNVYYIFGDFVRNEIYLTPVQQDQYGGFNLTEAITVVLDQPRMTDQGAETQTFINPTEFLPSDDPNVIYVSFQGIYKIQINP